MTSKPSLAPLWSSKVIENEQEVLQFAGSLYVLCHAQTRDQISRLVTEHVASTIGLMYARLAASYIRRRYGKSYRLPSFDKIEPRALRDYKRRAQQVFTDHEPELEHAMSRVAAELMKISYTIPPHESLRGTASRIGSMLSLLTLMKAVQSSSQGQVRNLLLDFPEHLEALAERGRTDTEGSKFEDDFVRVLEETG